MNWSSSKGFITRALPFVAAFAVAVFITSFFVDLNRPRFGGFRARRHHEMNRLRIENQELRNENLRLQEQLGNKKMSHGDKHPGDDECELRVFDVPLTPKAQK